MTLAEMTEIETIRAKIRARTGITGYASNLEALKKRLAELEQAQAQEAENGDEG